MLKKRLIACLLIQDGKLVRTRNFRTERIIGNPIVAIEYLNAWAIDEIMVLDIGSTGHYVERLDNNLETKHLLTDVIKYISSKCFVPLTVGGGIKTLSDIRAVLKAGADKVSINTNAIQNPGLIPAAAETFGSQCIVVSIDAKKTSTNSYQVFTDRGQTATGKSVLEWAKQVEKLGAGEILINSIDRDGTHNGYDYKLISKLADNLNIPVIAIGGVGKWNHFVKGFNSGHASAVAAANIFHFSEQSAQQAKKYLSKMGIDVRL